MTEGARKSALRFGRETLDTCCCAKYFVIQSMLTLIDVSALKTTWRQPRRRPLNVKFILPALKEATDPYWRPVKYSLFPPLGLATLAGFLTPDDQARIVDEHVEPLTLDDAPDVV